MTELETLKRAKTYMEKLVNGINPLDDTAIADGEVFMEVVHSLFVDKQCRRCKMEVRM